MKIKSSQELVEEAKKHIKTLSAKDIKKLNENNECVLVDIRDIREIWKEGTIKNAIHIPRGMLEFWMDPLSPYYQEKKIGEKKEMILFCALGFRSALATKTLVEMGFSNVANTDGGFEALKKTGLQIIQKEKK